MNEARVPITPNPSSDFRTQVLTLVEQLVLAVEENEPPSSSPGCLYRIGHCVLTQMLQISHIRMVRFNIMTYSRF